MRNACQEQIFKLANKNSRVLFIGSDLGAGVQDLLKKKTTKSVYDGRCI